MKSNIRKKVLVVLLLILSSNIVFAQLPKNHGKIRSKLFLGESNNQPLVVFFGGSEGGNIWADDSKKEFRDKLIGHGYAVLTIGYFGLKKTPKYLDRISIDAIPDSIAQIANNSKINNRKIAIIGGSRGSELILNLASRYKQFNLVIAITPSHVSFPFTTQKRTTSSWTYNGVEIPAVPIDWKMTESIGWEGIFSAVVKNELDVDQALIKVENINGPILLISAKDDNLWPSETMSNEIIRRLEAKSFIHFYEHLSLEGDHGDLVGHLDIIYDFLINHFDKQNTDDNR